MKKLTDSAQFLMRKHMAGRAKAGGKDKKGGEGSQHIASKIFVLKKLTSIKEISLPKMLKKGRKDKMTFTLTINSHFSMLVNPEKVLDLIAQIAHITANKQVDKIVIDQRYMESHDLSSEILLAQVVGSVRAYKKKKGQQFEIAGIYPENKDFAKLIRSIGIVAEIKAQSDHFSTDYPETMEVFRARCTKVEEVSLFSSDKKNQVTSRFTDHVNRCLAVVKRRLTDDAESELGAIVGELLGNAEDHANISERHWQTYGFMDKNEKGQIFQQITIMNFGQSIAASFLDKKNVDTVYNLVSSYIKIHQDKVDLRVLLTVMAFQQNVSSKIDEQSDRGQGLTDLLLFMESLSTECSENGSSQVEMSIISGNTSIYFDGTYIPIMDETSKRNLVFFNKDNSFMSPPDNKYVKKNGGRLLSRCYNYFEISLEQRRTFGVG